MFEELRTTADAYDSVVIRIHWRNRMGKQTKLGKHNTEVGSQVSLWYKTKLFCRRARTQLDPSRLCVYGNITRRWIDNRIVDGEGGYITDVEGLTAKEEWDLEITGNNMGSAAFLQAYRSGLGLG